MTSSGSWLVRSAWLAVVATMAAAGPTKLPKIAVLATGGTIAAVGTEETYTAGIINAEDILASVPQLAEEVTVAATVQVSNVASQDLTDEIYVDLAKAIMQQLAKPHIVGVVVTHGTDTMAETAFLMDLMIDDPKPIVFVGSTRPATALSADGPANLLDAARVAADPDARNRGPMIVFAGEIHPARYVVKGSTESLTVFKSPNGGPIGFIGAGKPRFTTMPSVKLQPVFPVPEAPWPRVAILYGYPNDGAELVKCAAEYADGIVLCGMGNGNAAEAVISELAKAAKKGVAVVRSSRTGAGFTSRDVELDDAALGFVASQELNCEHARNLLQLALAQTDARDVDTIQSYFYTKATLV